MLFKVMAMIARLISALNYLNLFLLMVTEPTSNHVALKRRSTLGHDGNEPVKGSVQAHEPMAQFHRHCQHLED